MADLDYYGFGPAESDDASDMRRAGHVGHAVNFMGGVLSLALILGLAVWGYRLLVRDVSGVPVVRAMEGPMRVQPEDPGGDRAAHQGLAVNRIAAVGEAAPPPDEILLAPRSADLLPEDMAQGLMRTQPVLVRAPAPQPPKPEDPVEAAILEATTGVMAIEAQLSGIGLIEIIPASVPGMVKSPRPRLRPEGLAARPRAPAPTAADAVSEVVPAALRPGTRLVQFGAFDDAEEARQAWATLAGRFGTLMEGKQRVIEEAATGDRTFFRLRAAGFDDLADARRFCAAFVAERADCIPVVTR
jgi:hypothetical protein